MVIDSENRKCRPLPLVAEAELGRLEEIADRLRSICAGQHHRNHNRKAQIFHKPHYLWLIYQNKPKKINPEI